MQKFTWLPVVSINVVRPNLGISLFLCFHPMDFFMRCIQALNFIPIIGKRAEWKGGWVFYKNVFTMPLFNACYINMTIDAWYFYIRLANKSIQQFSGAATITMQCDLLEHVYKKEIMTNIIISMNERPYTNHEGLHSTISH